MRLKQHHAWLFTFTDLAFLLLISLSMIPSAPDDVTLHFSEMDVTPFKLVRVEIIQGSSTPLYAQYLQRDELLGKLEFLKERNIRPVLLPSKTSLTQDFLFAAGAIARAWDNTRSNAIVKPVNSAEEY
jgi:hypothetical protein